MADKLVYDKGFSKVVKALTILINSKFTEVKNIANSNKSAIATLNGSGSGSVKKIAQETIGIKKCTIRDKSDYISEGIDTITLQYPTGFNNNSKLLVQVLESNNSVISVQVKLNPNNYTLYFNSKFTNPDIIGNIHATWTELWINTN